MYIETFLKEISNKVGSDTKLKEILDVDIKTIRNLKNGRTKASTQVILKMKKYFNFDINKYFEELLKQEENS